jgi:hypothetical protein
MVRDKHCDALLTLLVIKDKVSSILITIRDLKADEVECSQPQLLLLFEKLVGVYESPIHATRGYLHVPRSRQSLSKSCNKLKEYLEKFIKPYLLGWNGGIRPVELDYCVKDIFATSFFNQEF